MYQSIIRDPGGSGLIRIQPDVCGQHAAVVNGSILIVPPGTTAFVAINGVLSRPYGPGRYEIFTGVDPFFVRLRSLLTRGDPGTAVSVFFVSTERSRFVRLGTGEIPFREHRFRLTMKALASCSLSFSISDPQRFLSKLVGSYCAAFSEEDLDPCIDQIVLAPIREAISREISKLDAAEFNSRLSHIGAMAAATIRPGLLEYGIRLERFALTAIHIPPSEIQRLYRLEQDYADGKTRTDLELDALQRIWNGSTHNRTLSEMMTGIPSRGQTPTGGAACGPGGAAGGMAPSMMQMMMLSQLLPALREPLAEMTRHTDLFGGTPSDAQGSAASAEAPPPMPDRYQRCPSCSGAVMRGSRICPICGYKF